MARHYFTGNQIAKVKVKNLKKKLKEILIKIKEKDNLDFIDKASQDIYIIIQGFHGPKFSKF